jgi:hypothetical protein
MIRSHDPSHPRGGRPIQAIEPLSARHPPNAVTAGLGCWDAENNAEED